VTYGINPPYGSPQEDVTAGAGKTFEADTIAPGRSYTDEQLRKLLE
jgi:hypothetical protein